MPAAITRDNHPGKRDRTTILIAAQSHPDRRTTLGFGVSFKLAKTLKDAHIPFVFTTGYGEEIIPPEFKDIERLEKPFELREIVHAVARLMKTTQPRSNCPGG